MISEMVKASKSGLMEAGMRENGATIKPMATASLYTQMETYTKATGSMTRRREREITLTQTVLTMMASGLMTSSMDMELNHGRMVRATRANTKTAKRKDRAD